MDLVLWRHAQAVDLTDPRGDDMARALTGRGRRQAESMAAWLRGRLPEHALVLASPALRTRQTAEALTPDARIVDAIAPDRGDVEALLKAAGWHEPARRHDTVVVVGHQPVLGMTAALLMAGEPQPWSVKKGAVWWLRARDHGCELVAVESPRV